MIYKLAFIVGKWRINDKLAYKPIMFRIYLFFDTFGTCCIESNRLCFLFT